jgi:hypothetical protein
MHRQEYYELRHIYEHVRIIEHEIRNILERDISRFEEGPAPEYHAPVKYTFEKSEELKHWEEKVREKTKRGKINLDELYQDTTNLMLESWWTSSAVLNLLTSSTSQLTLKSQCPQCGGHLVLRVDENKREIYLTCLNPQGPTCNRVWKLANY